MSVTDIEQRIVRYGDLQPCKTAFIDAHTPGSDQKENFTIIGGGVSESADQHVHINDTPGFNIGAAGQPPKCRNSLHSHRTAEVFFVLKGRWRFFWGRRGTAGEVILDEGDIINIPTGIFRGFENVGTDYGMIMAVLGGDDAGGGVIWAPEVIEDAKSHGLILGANGQLYDSKKGESLPDGIKPMATLTDAEMNNYPELSASVLVGSHVARYWDMMSLANDGAAQVIGEHGILPDKPGFTVELLSRESEPDRTWVSDKHSVLMPMRGHWKLNFNDGDTLLNPGDTCLIQPGMSYSMVPAMTGEASVYRITATDDEAGATWQPPR